MTFKEDAPKLNLRAKYVFVRTGELIIGNETHPFAGEAQITLFGEKESQHIVYTNAIEAGNKILANTGLLKFYGAPRKTRTRLLETVNKGARSIKVSPGLSWKVNETIAAVSTSMKWFENDYAVITAYDNVTGVVTLDRPLNYYHYGRATSTGIEYSGVDMRGEVMLLSRNIRIVGEDVDAWGC